MSGGGNLTIVELILRIEGQFESNWESYFSQNSISKHYVATIDLKKLNIKRGMQRIERGKQSTCIMGRLDKMPTDSASIVNKNGIHFIDYDQVSKTKAQRGQRSAVIKIPYWRHTIHNCIVIHSYMIPGLVSRRSNRKIDEIQNGIFIKMAHIMQMYSGGTSYKMLLEKLVNDFCNFGQKYHSKFRTKAWNSLRHFINKLKSTNDIMSTCNQFYFGTMDKLDTEQFINVSSIQNSVLKQTFERFNVIIDPYLFKTIDNDRANFRVNKTVQKMTIKLQKKQYNSFWLITKIDKLWFMLYITKIVNDLLLGWYHDNATMNILKKKRNGTGLHENLYKYEHKLMKSLLFTSALTPKKSNNFQIFFNLKLIWQAMELRSDAYYRQILQLKQKISTKINIHFTEENIQNKLQNANQTVLDMIHGILVKHFHTVVDTIKSMNSNQKTYSAFKQDVTNGLNIFYQYKLMHSQLIISPEHQNYSKYIDFAKEIRSNCKMNIKMLREMVYDNGCDVLHITHKSNIGKNVEDNTDMTHGIALAGDIIRNQNICTFQKTAELEKDKSKVITTNVDTESIRIKSNDNTTKIKHFTLHLEQTQRCLQNLAKGEFNKKVICIEQLAYRPQDQVIGCQNCFTLYHIGCIKVSICKYMLGKQKWWCCGLCLGLKQLDLTTFFESKNQTQFGNVNLKKSVIYFKKKINQLINDKLCGLSPSKFNISFQTIFAVKCICNCIFDNYLNVEQNELLQITGIILHQMKNKSYINMKPYINKLNQFDSQLIQQEFDVINNAVTYLNALISNMNVLNCNTNAKISVTNFDLLSILYGDCIFDDMIFSPHTLYDFVNKANEPIAGDILLFKWLDKLHKEVPILRIIKTNNNNNEKYDLFGFVSYDNMINTFVFNHVENENIYEVNDDIMQKFDFKCINGWKTCWVLLVYVKQDLKCEFSLKPLKLLSFTEQKTQTLPKQSKNVLKCTPTDKWKAMSDIIKMTESVTKFTVTKQQKIFIVENLKYIQLKDIDLYKQLIKNSNIGAYCCKQQNQKNPKRKRDDESEPIHIQNAFKINRDNSSRKHWKGYYFYGVHRAPGLISMDLKKVSNKLRNCGTNENALLYLKSNYNRTQYMDWMKYMKISCANVNAQQSSLLLLNYWKQK
eukprot:534300_1